jgi:hypothetical protein
MLINNLYQENSKNIFQIVTPIQQLLKAIGETSINDNVFYYNTLKYEIIKHLNFEELELLIDSIDDKSKKEVITKIIENEKNRWRPKIEEKYFDEIENSRVSLNTTDFITFCIGKKVDLQELKSKSLWQNIYEDIDYSLNQYLICAKTISYFETSQKLDTTVNQALALFFCFDKKAAITKFKRILKYDKTHRPHSSYEAEYFEMIRLFFNRLKLDFIPQIDFENKETLVAFSNENKKYISKEEIQLIIDDQDYFNKRTRVIDSKRILTPKQISNTTLFKNCLFLHFKELDKNISLKDIDVFVAFLTENNPSFNDVEIKSTQLTLNSLLKEQNDRDDFKELFSLLATYDILVDAKNNLAYLLSQFFNKTKGMSISSNKNILNGRKRLKYDNSAVESIRKEIKNCLNLK